MIGTISSGGSIWSTTLRASEGLRLRRERSPSFLPWACWLLTLSAGGIGLLGRKGRPRQLRHAKALRNWLAALLFILALQWMLALGLLGIMAWMWWMKGSEWWVFGILAALLVWATLDLYIVPYDLEPDHPVVVLYHYGGALVGYVGAGAFLYGLRNAWKAGEIHLVGRVRGEEWKTKRGIRRSERPLAFFCYFTGFGLLALGLAVVGIIFTLVPPDQW